ncbi:hypothetical protein [Inquilinus sp. CAU 1745]|uniref:DUF7079 family protein n=1 Tax=Inquilinus sp. CAU 1745 TaxID=3140369 RepID=UPI00325C03F1
MVRFAVRLLDIPPYVRVIGMSGETSKEVWIERRLPVWVALSELFIDTELQPAAYDAIARTIRQAGIGRAEALTILKEEVAPVFYSNTLSIAGNWTGWPEAEVRGSIMEHLSRGPVRRQVAVVAAKIWRSYAERWEEVARRLTD